MKSPNPSRAEWHRIAGLAALSLLVTPSSSRAQGADLLYQIVGNDDQGSALATADGLLLVGAESENINGTNSGGAYLYDLASGAQLVPELLPNDGAQGDFFGYSVAVSSSYSLVGAWLSDSAGPDSGAAYQFDSSTGALIRKLTSSDLAANDKFGASVAISGNLALVGAQDNDGHGSVYTFDLSTGQELAKLEAPFPSSGDNFGVAVALEGTTALVGASGSGGTAYLLDALTGVEIRQFHASSSGGFGRSVALHGNLALIGHPIGSGGNAHLFRIDPGAMLYTFAGGYGFGLSVALGETTAVVGAPWDDYLQPTIENGAAYFYDVDTGNHLQTIGAPSCGLAEPAFGWSVSLDGELVAVGAPKCSYVSVYDASLASAEAYCMGSACPCGNDSALGGCLNSTGDGGLMSAAGSSSASDDDLVLTTQSLPPGQFGILYMGSLAIQNPYGAGLRCAGGTVLRFLPPQSTGPAGVISAGPGLVASSCASPGGTSCITAGSTWHFQHWYRDPGGPCGASFNFSNGVRVLFQL